MSAKRRPKPPRTGFAMCNRMRVLDDEWIYEGAAARERLQDAFPVKAVEVEPPTLMRRVLDFLMGRGRG